MILELCELLFKGDIGEVAKVDVIDLVKLSLDTKRHDFYSFRWFGDFLRWRGSSIGIFFGLRILVFASRGEKFLESFVDFVGYFLKGILAE